MEYHVVKKCKEEIPRGGERLMDYILDWMKQAFVTHKKSREDFISLFEEHITAIEHRVDKSGGDKSVNTILPRYTDPFVAEFIYIQYALFQIEARPSDFNNAIRLIIRFLKNLDFLYRYDIVKGSLPGESNTSQGKG